MGMMEQDPSFSLTLLPPDILIPDKEQTFNAVSLVRADSFSRLSVRELLPSESGRLRLSPYLPKTKRKAVAYSTKGATRFFCQKIIADNKSQTAVIPSIGGTPRGGWVSCAVGKDTERKEEKQWE